MRIQSLTSVWTALAAATAVAQVPSVRTLAKPDAEYPQAFIRIGSVHELKDGRVIVGEVHLRDGTLQAINFATGTATQVARKGAGPGEFAGRPSSLMTFAGDTTVMYDGGNARFLLIGPDGKPGRTEPAKPSQWTFNLAWGDSRGRVYSGLEADAVNASELADTAFVVRFTLASGKLDTVGARRVPKTDLSCFNDGKMSGCRTEEVPFAVHDDWAVFPDGRLAIVRGKDYHVEFYGANGAKTSGPPTKFVPIPVTAADKDSVRKARSPKPGPDGKITMPRIPPIIEPSVWYPTKAPFGEGSTWAGPGGQLWVQISNKAGDNAPKFDVFDAKGVRIATFALPAGTRVVGFGARSIYTSRVDADDQQFLQRFTLPPIR